MQIDDHGEEWGWNNDEDCSLLLICRGVKNGYRNEPPGSRIDFIFVRAEGHQKNRIIIGRLVSARDTSLIQNPVYPAFRPPRMHSGILLQLILPSGSNRPPKRAN
jgi:hypothetical protein